jgi:tellurite resistance protein TerC
MLIIDLAVFHKKEQEESIKEALIWTGVWIAMALIFGIGVYYYMGSATALDYYTGYLIEKSLSVDNIFVFLLVFSYFKVPPEYQHKVLFWGIFGALVMRLLFIFTGVALLERFHWIIYVFGGFLVFTGIKLALEKDKEVHPERNPVLKLVRKIFPTTKSYHGSRFFIRRMGKLIATPLFIVLIVIETTDLVFAIDSIPAILAITRDEFIVYSSNAFAILGLRALYFAVSGIMRLFHYLHYGLSLILVFVGIKMLLSDYYHIPTEFALGFIGVTLTVSVIASIKYPKEDQPIAKEKLPDE